MASFDRSPEDSPLVGARVRGPRGTGEVVHVLRQRRGRDALGVRWDGVGAVQGVPFGALDAAGVREVVTRREVRDG